MQNHQRKPQKNVVTCKISKMTAKAALSVALLASMGLSSMACPAATVAPAKTPQGEVELIFRRVDVVRANYGEIKAQAIVVVKNGTQNAIEVSDVKLTAAHGGFTDPIEEDADEENVDGEDTGAKAKKAKDPAFINQIKVEENQKLSSDQEATLLAIKTEGTGGNGTIPAGTVVEVPINFTMPLPEDPAILDVMFTWSRLKLILEGSMDVDGTTKTFGGESTVAMPRLPVVVLQNAQAASLDQGVKGSSYVNIGLSNKNPFDITVDSVSWSIIVAGKELRKLDEEKNASTNVPSVSAASFDEEFDLNETVYGKELKKILKQNTVPFKVSGYFMVKGVKREFLFQGDMQFPR